MKFVHRFSEGSWVNTERGGNLIRREVPVEGDQSGLGVDSAVLRDSLVNNRPRNGTNCRPFRFGRIAAHVDSGLLVTIWRSMSCDVTSNEEM